MGGVNLIHYLKSISGDDQNTIEEILISYDFQTGSYNKGYAENSEVHDRIDRVCKVIATEIESLMPNTDKRVFEAGAGEATVLSNVLKQIHYSQAYGNDISWSRAKCGQKYLEQNGCNDVQMFVGDMFQLPLKDNSVDILYTRNAMEPNGGHEEGLLKELYRVASHYLILVEPAYEMADEEAKKRMEYHGYIRNLKKHAEDLNYHIIKYELLKREEWARPENPVAMMVIEKNNETLQKNPFCCPITKSSLTCKESGYYSKDALIAYPTLGGIPLLVESSAVVATKYEELVQ